MSIPNAPAPCPNPTPFGLEDNAIVRTPVDDQFECNEPVFSSVALLAKEIAFMFGHGHCFKHFLAKIFEEMTM